MPPTFMSFVIPEPVARPDSRRGLRKRKRFFERRKDMDDPGAPIQYFIVSIMKFGDFHSHFSDVVSRMRQTVKELLKYDSTEGFKKQQDFLKGVFELIKDGEAPVPRIRPMSKHVCWVEKFLGLTSPRSPISQILKPS